MSRYDYEASKHVAASDYPFYALVMAAMRQADEENGDKLRAAFPEVWDELWARYHAPGGLLPEEQEAERSALSDAEDEAWLESKPEPVA